MLTTSLDDTARRVAALDTPSPRIVVSGGAVTPMELLTAVAAQLESPRVSGINFQLPVATHDGVVPETAFVGPGVRRHPKLSYVPSRLSRVPRLYAETLAPDVVLVHTTLPRDGKVSLGLEVNVLPAAIEAARARGALVVAQMNPRMPWTFGDAELDLDAIDVGVEVDTALPTVSPAHPDAEASAIGALVAERVSDGSTLQVGIGDVPDATIARLDGRRGLRVWTEMFSDGVHALEQAGALDPEVPLVTSFLIGSEELYAWVDRNPRIRVMRTETTNSPAIVAQQPRMTSINTALQVDLFDQANASRIGARIFSGFGGQTDFTVGATHSDGGQAIMALRSWHPKADVSTIVPLLQEPVTSFQHTSVVTEQGVAVMTGHDEKDQAANLIRHAAHPDVRDELWQEAGLLGLA